MTLLLDLDGTVRYAINGRFPGLDNQLLYLEAKSLILQAKSLNKTIVACSNQCGIEIGEKSLDNCKKEMKQLDERGLFDFILFCPHYQEDDRNCWKFDTRDKSWELCIGDKYRKPNPGMLNLGYILGGWDEYCLYVGDMYEDATAASNAKIPFMWADNWRSQVPIK